MLINPCSISGRGGSHQASCPLVHFELRGRTRASLLTFGAYALPLCPVASAAIEAVNGGALVDSTAAPALVLIIWQL